MRLPWSSLLLLSAAIFVAVTSEFLPIGLLPQMANELGVTEAQIGMLVTVFAGTVVVATAPLVHVTRALPRKSLLLVLLAVFALANLLAAIAPGYAVLLVSRVLGGAAHGVFWAVVSPYAARLVAPERLASAVAIATSGATLASIAGVPLGTLLGVAVGWRSSFAVIAVVVVVIALAVAIVLPPVERRSAPDPAAPVVRARAFRDATFWPVIVLCVTVALVTLGHATFYTYIAPWVIGVAGFAPASVAGVLLLFGAAGAVGVAAAGVLGDRFPRGLLPVLLVGVIVSVTAVSAFAAVPPAVIVFLVLWSAFLGGVPIIFQARLLRTASESLRDIGSAWLTVAFNVGIGGGALAGGLVLETWSLAALPLVTTACLVVALVMVLVSIPTRRRVAVT
ncbi:MAG: MFS transporter [Microcella sp.]|uniref:MFS transporter n=1 Tax=Microcella sp. TaxID=1913979 RepID=UPI0024CE03D1|nr:MFS transporter [Microcella sp.]UYN83396.1 MAG: MFS transporter [Microcella sp.]